LGRHDPRKGLPVLLRAWPGLRRDGLRLRVVGADPLAVRLLLTRLRVPDEGIDVLGYLDDEVLTEELAAAKLVVAPSLGNESFGMVITRAFASATPVVASDISGYRELVTPETGVLAAPGDPDALAEAIAELLADEPARVERGCAARELAASRVRVAAGRAAARRLLRARSLAGEARSAGQAEHARPDEAHDPARRLDDRLAVPAAQLRDRRVDASLHLDHALAQPELAEPLPQAASCS